MAQFDAHRLADGTYVLNVQSDFLASYETVLVVPLLRLAEIDTGPSRLHPLIRIEDEHFLLAPQLMSAVRVRLLGPPIASLVQHEYAIKAAIDIVLTGF